VSWLNPDDVLVVVAEPWLGLEVFQRVARERGEVASSVIRKDGVPWSGTKKGFRKSVAEVSALKVDMWIRREMRIGYLIDYEVADTGLILTIRLQDKTVDRKEAEKEIRGLVIEEFLKQVGALVEERQGKGR